MRLSVQRWLSLQIHGLEHVGDDARRCSRSCRARPGSSTASRRPRRTSRTTGATIVLSASPSALMNAEVGLARRCSVRTRVRVGERREHRDREDADEPERDELLFVRDRPPAAKAPQVFRVLTHHRSGRRCGGFFAGDRRHDSRDVDAHAEALVANPVALREVVDAPGAREDEAAQYQRDRE